LDSVAQLVAPIEELVAGVDAHVGGKRIPARDGRQDDAARTIQRRAKQSVGAVIRPEKAIVGDVQAEAADVAPGRGHRPAQRDDLEVQPVEIHPFELAGPAVGPENAARIRWQRQKQPAEGQGAG